VTHADALKRFPAIIPGSNCLGQLLPLDSTDGRHYYFCSTCKRALVFDDKGTLITTYRLGPVSRLAALFFVWLDSWLPDPKD
jgi:hypothetical protein